MSDEAALLAAIIHHPNEDTPRLAYADWLDEHDAPIQADFVRTQCRLASCSADDPDYPDLLERHAELVAQFGPIAKMTVPKLPPGIVFDNYPAHGADHFRRGFLYTVRGQWDDYQMSPDDGETEQFCAGLPELIATTTARQLSLSDLRAEQLARVLAAPGAESLGGLIVSPMVWDEGDPLLRAIAVAKCVPSLERLSLYITTSTVALAALARARFDRLVHIDLPMLEGRVRDLRPVLAAKWFQQLRSVRVGASDGPVESALLVALAKLPHLESLDLRCQFAAGLKALGTARGFRALTQLSVWFNLSIAGVTQMAKGVFPRLAELELYSVGGPHILALLKARWVPQLRVLSLHNGTLSEKSVVALSKSAAAANLRILRFDDITMSKAALAALGDGTRFPNLTTLDLGAWTARRKTKVADTAAFAKALSLPRLRHLNLSGWPLGEAGAKALAANPALANLTRLSLRNCAIGEKGLTAIVRSPHLQQLIELDVENNKLKTAASLCDKKWLPRLAAVRLVGNAISPAAHRELHAARELIA